MQISVLECRSYKAKSKEGERLSEMHILADMGVRISHTSVVDFAKDEKVAFCRMWDMCSPLPYPAVYSIRSRVLCSDTGGQLYVRCSSLRTDQ